MEFIAHTETETEDIARKIASELIIPGIVFLSGPLGAGKSLFARSLIRTLMDDVTLEVPSPTFSLIQEYDAPCGMIYHYDLYRLEESEGIFELGWEDNLAAGLNLIEWPEKLGTLRPQSALDIHISILDNEPNARKILIENKT